MFSDLVTVVFADFAWHCYQHNILEMFCVSCSFTFLVIALATTVSALVDEGTVGYSKYSTDGRSSCLVLVQWMKGQPRTVNQCLFKCHV